jgi:hypothetical protein
MRNFGVVSGMAMLALSPAAAAKRPPHIVVDKSDNPLVIKGFLDEEGGLLGAIRLHGIGKVGAFRVLFSNLNEVAGDEVVSRAHLSLSGGTSIRKDEYKDAVITVESIVSPGQYSGHVDLVPQGQRRKNGTRVEIKVTASTHPKLVAVAPFDRVKGGFAHCGPLGCDATALLVPGSAGTEQQSVKFTLDPDTEAQVTNQEVFASGERGGHQLTEEELGISGAVLSSKHGTLSVPLKIDPSELPADHYTGTLHLTVEDLDEPVTIPIDFNVRNEPLWALLFIALGIVLGRLGGLIRGAPDRLKKRATVLERRVTAEVTDGENKTALMSKIAVAQTAIDNGELWLAKESLDDVKKALDQLRPRLLLFQLDALGPLGDAISWVSRAIHWLGRAIMWVFRKISPADYALSAGTHLVAVFVWIGLLIVGFNTLYVAQGASFGSNGIFDYVGFVLWGLTADIASRGLGNLTAGTAAA